VTDLDATLVKQLLNVSVTQGKSVVEPNGVLDDRHGKAVAVGLGIGHSGSAYLKLVKATQTSGALSQKLYL